MHWKFPFSMYMTRGPTNSTEKLSLGVWMSSNFHDVNIFLKKSFPRNSQIHQMNCESLKQSRKSTLVSFLNNLYFIGGNLATLEDQAVFFSSLPELKYFIQNWLSCHTALTSLNQFAYIFIRLRRTSMSFSALSCKRAPLYQRHWVMNIIILRLHILSVIETCI